MAVLDDKFTRSVTLLKDLRPGTKNVTCLFIVIDKGTTNHTKDGSIVRKCRVADRSGSVCFSLWNEQASAIEAGDILRLIRGYTSLWKGAMVLYSGKYGKLEKIGEFTMVYSEMPDMSSHDHDFLPKQQQKRSPQPSGGGDRPLNDLVPTSTGPSGNGRTLLGQSPGNGRMGTTIQGPGMGNWNGNNHLNSDPPPPPPPVGQLMSDHLPLPAAPNGNGHERSQQLPHSRHALPPDTRDSNFSKGHMKTPNSSISNNSSSYERHHPYQRPAGHFPQGAESRFTGNSVKPGYTSRASDIPVSDPRAHPARLR